MAVVFFTTAFLSINNLIETELLSKSYAFIVGAILCSTYIIILGKSNKMLFDTLTVLILLLIGYLLIRMGISGQFGVKFMLVISFFLFYFFFRAIGNQYNNYIELIIVFICVLEAIYGLAQVFDLACVTSGFGMVANFDNPAGLAAVLSLGVPFSLSLTDKTKTLKYIGFISTGLIVLSVVLSESRSGILATSIVIGVFILCKFMSFFKQYKVISFFILLLCCSLSIGLFCMKKKSALGRILIWKSSVEMIKDMPITGHGPGAFMVDYMDYQADYFRNNPESYYCQLVDNVSHPFNECILLIVEYGLLGLLILLLIVVFIIIHSKKMTSILLCLLSIVVFSCFSYPTRYAFVLLLLAYCLANVMFVENSEQYLNYILRIVGITIVSILSYILIRDIRFELEWGNLVKQSLSGKMLESLKDYESLYDIWNGNPLFLYNYGAILNNAGYYQLSLNTMTQCEMYWNDYDVQLLLADCYLQKKMFDRAEECLVLASNMCPNRFIPLYQLVHLYDRIGEKEKAYDLAEKITHKVVKIPSFKVQRIKNEMKEYVENRI